MNMNGKKPGRETMNKRELMIIHCPEKAMALELINTIRCSRDQQEAMNGWEKYRDKTFYGIQTAPEPEIIFFGALDDESLKDKTIVEFMDWKTASIRENIEERVFVYMSRSDIEDNCRERGIKVTKNRSAMEAKLIEAMVQEIVSKGDIK